MANDVLSALEGQRVTLTKRSGTKLTVLVLSSSPAADVVICALVPSGDVVVLRKDEIVDVRVKLAPQGASAIDDTLWSRPAGAAPAFVPLPPPAPAPPPEPAPPNSRYFGLSIGLAPSVLLDLDVHHFYAFANVSVLLPLLTKQSFGTSFPFSGVSNDHLWSFALGAGGTFRLQPSTRWQFDFYVIGGGSNWSLDSNFVSTYAAFGAGLGFHVTTESGVTLAFKFPILGDVTSSSGSASTNVGTFYAFCLASLPVLSVGYRF